MAIYTKSVLDYALDYVQNGWKVLPLYHIDQYNLCSCGKGVHCDTPGKHPCLNDWQHLATAIIPQVRRWFDRGFANIGILTGNGLIVVDIDPKNGGSIEILERMGEVPRTRKVRTGSGGYHLYYSYDPSIDLRDTASVIAPGIDTRANGGQVVAPPSTHISGNRYELIDDAQISPLPEWLLNILQAIPTEEEKTQGKKGHTKDKKSTSSAGKDIPDGARNDTLFREACKLRQKGLEEDEILERIRELNETCSPPLSDDELERIAASAGRYEPGDSKPQDGEGTPKQTRKSSLDTLLTFIELTGADFFVGDDDAGYVRVPVNGHNEMYGLSQGSCRSWVSSLYYAQTGRGLSNSTIQDAMNTLEAKARASGKKESVFTRHAFQNGNLYIDLANEQWQVVEISAEGWKVLDQSPVAFRRLKGILPLPIPERGGSIADMRTFFNVRDEQDWTLLLGWLVGTLHPTGPYAHLVITGPKGSAKSTATKRVKALIDPNIAGLRNLPKDDRDMAIEARNNWLLAYDNLSHISIGFSDALCRLATGGAFSTRKLHSDDDEVLFSFKRPVVLNTIEDIVKRTDLLDRVVLINLEQVEGYKSDQELEDEFNEARPRLLGTLYDAVSVALRDYRSVQVDKTFRMADFAKWAKASEQSLGFNEGDFEKAYKQNKEVVNDLVIESNPIAHAILTLMRLEREWVGTASELLSKLIQPDGTPEREWPKKANQLTNKLRQIESNLRERGVDIVFTRRHGGGRVIAIRHKVDNVEPATACNTQQKMDTDGEGW